MAVTFTREFYINLVLFVVACIALGLSIWAFAKPCKKDRFGDNSVSCSTGKLINLDNETFKPKCILQGKIRQGWNNFIISINFSFDFKRGILTIEDNSNINVLGTGATGDIYVTRGDYLIKKINANEYELNPGNEKIAIKTSTLKNLTLDITAFKIILDDNEFIKIVQLYTISKYENFYTAEGWLTFEAKNDNLNILNDTNITLNHK
jgi:hypothetical protein